VSIHVQIGEQETKPTVEINYMDLKDMQGRSQKDTIQIEGNSSRDTHVALDATGVFNAKKPVINENNAHEHRESGVPVEIDMLGGRRRLFSTQETFSKVETVGPVLPVQLSPLISKASRVLSIDRCR